MSTHKLATITLGKVLRHFMASFGQWFYIKMSPHLTQSYAQFSQQLLGLQRWVGRSGRVERESDSNREGELSPPQQSYRVTQCWSYLTRSILYYGISPDDTENFRLTSFSFSHFVSEFSANVPRTSHEVTRPDAGRLEVQSGESESPNPERE